MKTKFAIAITVLLAWISIINYFFIRPSFFGPVGGWEASKAKIETKYGYNEQVKLAALQLGEAYQKVIDNPNDISILNELDKGMGCISGLLIKQGIERSKALAPWSDIESLVISTYEQQRRYIHFNANLSGSMLTAINHDTSQCRFEIEN